MRMHAGRSTRSHPGISMHELEPQLLATAASLVKASRHRYMQARPLSCHNIAQGRQTTETAELRFSSH